jgi:hypothetical protein
MMQYSSVIVFSFIYPRSIMSSSSINDPPQFLTLTHFSKKPCQLHGAEESSDTCKITVIVTTLIFSMPTSSQVEERLLQFSLQLTHQSKMEQWSLEALSFTEILNVSALFCCSLCNYLSNC